MNSPLTQKPSIKEEASSTRSNTPAVDASRVVASRDQVGFYGFGNNDIREFRVPVEALRNFRFTPRFMIQSKKEELLLRLSELFFFLRRLELCLVDLCLKDSVDLKKLSVLADEVTELKGVAREAVPPGAAPRIRRRRSEQMNTLFQFLAGGAFGLFAVGLFWLAVELDNAELQAGKSPHSGFCPESPTPMKAFDGLEQPSRPHGMRKRNNQ